MSQVRVDQQIYQMPPKEGFTVAHFLTVADVERSLRFYETVFGGHILSRGDSKGAPGYIQIANTWLLVNPGGGPTPDKPMVLYYRSWAKQSGRCLRLSSRTREGICTRRANQCLLCRVSRHQSEFSEYPAMTQSQRAKYGGDDRTLPRV